MAPQVPPWTTNLAGRDSTLPPELLPLPLPNPPLRPLLLLHPTDRRRQRLHKATPTLSILSKRNLRNRYNLSNLPSTHNPPPIMTHTPTPAESVRITLDRLHRAYTSLPPPFSTSSLNNSTLLSSRCRPAAVLDRPHRLQMRHYRRHLEDSSTVVPTTLPCHLHQNARTLVAGMTLRLSKTSALRAGTSTNLPRSLRPSPAPWGRLVLHLASRRTSTKARVHHSPLRRGQVVEILVPLHHHKTGCSPRCNLDLDRTVLLLCPMVCRHPSG